MKHFLHSFIPPEPLNFFGPECSGKTTLEAQFVLRKLEKGHPVCLLDDYNPLDWTFAEKLGVKRKQ